MPSQLWKQIIGALGVIAVLHGLVCIHLILLNICLIVHIQHGRPLGRFYFCRPAILDTASAPRLVETFSLCRWIKVNTSWPSKICHSVEVLDHLGIILKLVKSTWQWLNRIECCFSLSERSIHLFIIIYHGWLGIHLVLVCIIIQLIRPRIDIAYWDTAATLA